jgi:O-antigen ligase
MNLIKKGYQVFLIWGIFFLPFNSQIPDWFGFLGEYSRDSSPIFFLVAFILLIIYSVFQGNIYIPLKSTIYALFLFFIILLCLSTLLNIFNILEYYFKQTTGIQRFIRQLLSVVIVGVAFFLVFVNVCRDYGVKVFFLKIRKLFFISFILVFVCGILEYVIISYNIKSLIPIFEIFNNLPFVELNLNYTLERVSSLTYEPPALGSYLMTISGFMFSYIITGKKAVRFIPFFLVIILSLLSKSRTALVVIILQSIVGFYLSYKMFPSFRRFFVKAALLGSVLSLFAIVIFWRPISEGVTERIESLDITKVEYNSKDNSISNKSRLGIQYAMFKVYKEYPIFGTGWGQQAFESRFHYPRWATDRNYEFSTKYLNENIKSFPPGFNMYLRILTETGIIGFLVFILFLYLIVKETIFLYKTSVEHRFITVALLIAFTGSIINWLQIDSFGVYGFWLGLAILIILKKTLSEQANCLNSAL